MNPQEQLEIVAAITLENSRQIGILAKACAHLVGLAVPLLPDQPDLKIEVAIHLSDLEVLQRQVALLTPQLTELAGKMDLKFPPAG